MDCTHHQTEIIRERVYMGPVAGGDDIWEPAHGNVTVTDRCLGCGVLRERNINGRHEEHGPFGLSEEEHRAELLATLRSARRNLPAIPEQLRMVARDGRTVTVTCEDDGMLCLYGDARNDDAVASALPREWVERAAAVRREALRRQSLELSLQGL